MRMALASYTFGRLIIIYLHKSLLICNMHIFSLVNSSFEYWRLWNTLYHFRVLFRLVVSTHQMRDDVDWDRKDNCTIFLAGNVIQSL